MKELADCTLFRNMDTAEIEKCLGCSQAKETIYKRGEIVFHMDTLPRYLYILLSGQINICRDNPSGKQVILTSLSEYGSIFGEVFLFLSQTTYPNYAISQKESRIIQIPKSFFCHSCQEGCPHHIQLNQNMLSILAEKAYYLNQKLQLVFGTTLRQKLARYFLGYGTVNFQLELTREQLADYLGTARPSLSRELMKMQEEGLLSINGKYIKIENPALLETYL